MKRQRAAVESFAKRAGYGILQEYADEGVKCDQEIDERPGFRALLDRIVGNGVRVVRSEFLAEKILTLCNRDYCAEFERIVDTR